VSSLVRSCVVGGTLASACGCALPPLTIGEWQDSDAPEGDTEGNSDGGAVGDEATDGDPSGGRPFSCAPRPLELVACPAFADTAESPWEATIEWRWGSDRGSRVAPLVGHFADDDDDGRYGPGDSTSIVVVAAAAHDEGASTCALELVKAPGEGGPLGSLDAACDVAPAFGDIDGDCVPEIVFVAITSEGPRLAAIEPDGDVDWVADEMLAGEMLPGEILPGEMPTGAIAVHDLDADGRAEVLFAGTVYDHVGQRRFSYGGAAADEAPYAVDLDGDALAEIVTPRGVWGTGGTLAIDLSALPPGSRLYPIDGDRDGDPELWVQTSSGLVVIDPVTAMAQEVGPGQGQLGLDAVSTGIVDDVDGDGLPELVGAWGSRVELAWTGERTLAEIWRTVGLDSSPVRGWPTAFDLDADGSAEVIVAGADRILVVDGIDGVQSLVGEVAPTLGATSMPVVADVDDDGAAEIVFVSAAGPALTVLGHAGDGWADARPVWNQVAANVTNVGDDGSIPSVPVRNWSQLDTFGTNARVHDGRLCARAAPG